jgi:hypothetical protein
VFPLTASTAGMAWSGPRLHHARPAAGQLSGAEEHPQPVGHCWGREPAAGAGVYRAFQRLQRAPYPRVLAQHDNTGAASLGSPSRSSGNRNSSSR